MTQFITFFSSRPHYHSWMVGCVFLLCTQISYGSLAKDVTASSHPMLCGPYAIYLFLKINDIDVKMQEILDYPGAQHPKGMSLYSIKECCEHFGKKVAVRTCTPSDLTQIDLPAIIRVHPIGATESENDLGHYYVLTRFVGKDRIESFDATSGQLHYSWLRKINNVWDGEIIISRKSLFNSRNTFIICLLFLLFGFFLFFSRSFHGLLKTRRSLFTCTCLVVGIFFVFLFFFYGGNTRKSIRTFTPPQIIRRSDRAILNCGFFIWTILGGSGNYLDFLATQDDLMEEPKENLGEAVNVLHKVDIDSKLVKINMDELRQLSCPSILFMEETPGNGYFACCLEIDDHRVFILKGDSVTFHPVSLDAFRAIWSGYAVIPVSQKKCMMWNPSYIQIISIVVLGIALFSAFSSMRDRFVNKKFSNII